MPLHKRQKLNLLISGIGAGSCTFQAERNAEIKQLISSYPRITLTFNNLCAHFPVF